MKAENHFEIPNCGMNLFLAHEGYLTGHAIIPFIGNLKTKTYKYHPTFLLPKLEESCWCHIIINNIRKILQLLKNLTFNSILSYKAALLYVLKITTKQKRSYYPIPFPSNGNAVSNSVIPAFNLKGTWFLTSFKAYLYKHIQIRSHLTTNGECQHQNPNFIILHLAIKYNQIKNTFKLAETHQNSTCPWLATKTTLFQQ